MDETLDDKVKRLEREMSDLRSMVGTIRTTTDRHSLVMVEVSDITKKVAAANERYLEKLQALFRKVFPDHGSFLAEFDRILGKDTGPEDPKKPKG